jgi:site-specific recombinase XerD
MSDGAYNELGLTLQRFVDWAREQGWRYEMAPGHLRHFRQFLQRRGVEQLGEVNAALLSEYQRSLLVHRSRMTVNGYLRTLRALWRYLLKEELVTEDASRGLRSLHPGYFVPHLYDAQELARIEQATRKTIAQARSREQRCSRRTQYAAFALLRDCGLRVSEACKLDVNDYDARARTLLIERTKFFKTRRIPLPRSTCTMLTHYLKHRDQWVRNPGESPALLLSKNGYRLHRCVLEAHFKRCLCELGLYRPRRQQGRTVFGSTNLHALRHSFAVRTLERWHREGRDVERLLPLLSGYMGHAKVSYTTHYLHLTPSLRQLASERFAQTALFRIDHDGSLTDEQ